MGATVRVIKDTRFEGLHVLAKRVQAGDRQVFVGVPSGAGEHGGLPLATVAAIHEFGSPSRGIPERSFLRGTILRELPAIKTMNMVNMAKIAQGGFTVRTALGRLGLFVASRVKASFTEGRFAPNAPSTIKGKGSDRPLIDTGQLRASITWTLSDPDAPAAVAAVPAAGEAA